MLPRYDAKRDANEPLIVEALQAVGATVVRLHKPLDLLVCYQGTLWLIEVKTEEGSLEKSQREFIDACGSSHVAVVRTPEEALRAIRALKCEV